MPIITSSSFPSTTSTHNPNMPPEIPTRPRSRSWQGLSTFSGALTKLDVRRITVSSALGTKMVVSAPSPRDIPASSPISPATPTSSILSALRIPMSPLSPPASPTSARLSVFGEPSFTSFTKYRVRVFTKEGFDYHYSEIKLPQQRVPSIRVSPPDESPLQTRFLDPRSPPNIPPYTTRHSSALSSAEFIYRRTRSLEPETAQPMIQRRRRRASTPARRPGRLVTMGYNRGVNADWRTTRPPIPSDTPTPLPPRPDTPVVRLLATPPVSPVESLTIPKDIEVGHDIGCLSTPQEQREPPLSPPHTPRRQKSDDSLSWLSQELAISDEVEEDKPVVEEKPLESPFIDFSTPATPFRREFPDLFPTIEEEEEGEEEGKETAVYAEEITAEPERIPAGEPVEQTTTEANTLLSLPAEILVRIFSGLPSASEIVSFSLTSPHLHRIFTENATSIISSAVGTTSPALRTLLSTPKLHPTSFKEYSHAITTSIETASMLKSAIRARCKNFLSKHLLEASASDEKAFDDAIFHVWAFSLHFSEALSNVAGQISWLKSRRLGMQQLRDLLEVYQCIGVLLCPLTTDLSLAVKAGVVPELGKHCVLEMEEGVELWVVYLQTLDLETLRPVIEAEEEDEAGRWDAIVRQGLWRWHMAEHPARKTALRRFLKAAVGQVYAELSDIERKTRLQDKWGREGLWGENLWGETWEI
ncbi:hypothetical protein BZA05DRAFT_405140 [Tricharina praecox]|uniref:uncharacterized protein n=1 Tax=Tricharina praecox TaxID=43433 RepID=UPI0022209114|nr:uncharacterized protein BZA05DRAFT_405140 [Tricharina praecox]KAI5847534.1 hypothetical protein BZA05DRAFT_405140 [Tricharina praecox]